MKRESPEIVRLLEILADHDVEYVLAGSVAVAAWGAEIGIPGDLDIIPATTERNLRKFDDALSVMAAKPIPATGEWQRSDEGFEWVEFDSSDPRRGATPASPDPAVPASFDSLFTTAYSALDVVPEISGRYEEVAPRATHLQVHGVNNVRVLSIEDLLAQLTVPRRKKDASRVAHLRKRQLGV